MFLWETISLNRYICTPTADPQGAAQFQVAQVAFDSEPGQGWLEVRSLCMYIVRIYDMIWYDMI